MQVKDLQPEVLANEQFERHIVSRFIVDIDEEKSYESNGLYRLNPFSVIVDDAQCFSLIDIDEDEVEHKSEPHLQYTISFNFGNEELIPCYEANLSIPVRYQIVLRWLMSQSREKTIFQHFSVHELHNYVQKSSREASRTKVWICNCESGIAYRNSKCLEDRSSPGPSYGEFVCIDERFWIEDEWWLRVGQNKYLPKRTPDGVDLFIEFKNPSCKEIAYLCQYLSYYGALTKL